MKRIKFLFVFTLISLSVLAQTKVDTAQHAMSIQFNYSALILPSVLIGYGVVGLENRPIQALNANIRNEIKARIDSRTTIDDFLQYSAVVSVYGLNQLGIHGKNNFTRRTLILATACLLTASTVTIIKETGNVERPDGSSRNSFPSGHTATAFMGAEFLYQEYKDISIWYGVSGYLAALCTASFRMSNNRHWFTDVTAGAGIGILTTKIAYWINPFLQQRVLKAKEFNRSVVMPYYDGTAYGFQTAYKF